MLTSLDFAEHTVHGIDHGEQSAGYVFGQREFPVSQEREQAFPGMRHFLQVGESQKSATSLNGVDRPKNAGQQFLGRRLLFQLHQFLVQPVQVLVAFD